MPRPVHAQGRPGTEVIPTDWEATHRPVAEKTLRGRVALRKPGGTQGWSAAKEQNVLVPHEPYAADVPARVQVLTNDAREIAAAGDTETVTRYLVVIPADHAPAEDDLVALTATGDPALDGRTLRVFSVVHGTERFERDLFCTLTD